jgi:manganese/zinc/iron transport system substrate-binding protein
MSGSTSLSRSLAVESIRDALTKSHPATSRRIFAAAPSELQREMADLGWLDQAGNRCDPRPRRVLITAHDAFGFTSGAPYDLEVRGLQGLSTRTWPGWKGINDLVTLIAERGIKAVFVESSVRGENIEAVHRGRPRFKAAICASAANCTGDTMGGAGTSAGNFYGNGSP